MENRSPLLRCQTSLLVFPTYEMLFRHLYDRFRGQEGGGLHFLLLAGSEDKAYLMRLFAKVHATEASATESVEASRVCFRRGNLQLEVRQTAERLARTLRPQTRLGTEEVRFESIIAPYDSLLMDVAALRDANFVREVMEPLCAHELCASFFHVQSGPRSPYSTTNSNNRETTTPKGVLKGLVEAVRKM